MSEKDTRDRKKWLSRKAAICIANALGHIAASLGQWAMRHCRNEDSADLAELSHHIMQAREIALKLRDKNCE